MKRTLGILCVVTLVALASSDATAQLRGLGRFGGKCTDEGGAPLGGVAIRATLVGNGGDIDSSSDETGVWAVNGLAKGEWDVTFEKTGYLPRRAKITLPVELARVPPIVIALKKAS